MWSSEFSVICRHVGTFDILYFHDFILALFLRLLVLSIKIITLVFFIHCFNFLDFFFFYIASAFAIHNFSVIVNFFNS